MKIEKLLKNRKREQVRKHGKCWLSAVLSLLVLIIGYLLGNVPVPLPDEVEVLQDWDRVKTLFRWKGDSVPDEVLLVNVAYDKQLVDFSKEGIPVGQVPITDRWKLFHFLQQAKEANNYRYILLDVFFEQGYESEIDSALFNLIAHMERITIPKHKDALLQDSILYTQAAYADYLSPWKDTDFVRYQFLYNGQPTIPLRMYDALNKGNIKQWGWLYWSDGWLCQNGVTLKMPIQLSRDYEEVEDKRKYYALYLGADLLDSLTSVSEDIDGKIVVVGDFENDVHDTYLGSQPGSLICLNAYYALVRGDHILRGQGYAIAVFWLLIGILYFLLSYAYLNGFTLTSLTDNPWLKILLSLLGTNFIFWVVAVVAYVSPLNFVYHIWFPIGFFSFQDFVTNIFSTYKSAVQK